MTRTLIIGLDGASLDLIEPWAEEGHLPHLHTLMQRGIYGELRSVMPVLSSAAWVSFMTGMNPGKHGVYDFVQRDLTTYRRYLVRGGTEIKAPSLWRMLSAAGKRVGIVNVPMTHPPEAINGFLITGLGTPLYQPFTYPPELENALRADGYRVNKQAHYAPGAEQKFLDEVYALTDIQAQAALNLASSEPWDFFMHVIRDPDEMAHFFWRYMDTSHPAYDPVAAEKYGSALRDYYSHIDGWIGRFLERAGPQTDVIILSDHGCGPLYKDVMLNGWLQQTGFLNMKQDQATSNRLRQQLARAGIHRQRVSQLLRDSGLGRVEKLIKDILGDRIDLLSAGENWDMSDVVDWPHTQAYSFGYHGQIYVNLDGRESQGVVPPSQYDAVCREIAEELSRLVDPEDGLPVVSAVYRKEELFRGDNLKWAPDLTVIMRDLAYITRQGYEFAGAGKQLFAAPLTHESGSHREMGVLIAAGPSFTKRGPADKPASLMDIAPTVLHLHGLAVPASMDGAVLQDWLRSDLRQYAVSFDNTRGDLALDGDAGESREGDAALWDHLRNLGYVE